MSVPRGFPSAERLRQVFVYDHERGTFSRRSDGKPAGHAFTVKGRQKYLDLCVDSTRILAQQAAVVMMTGQPAHGLIGFKDGDSLNLAWQNLVVSDAARIQHQAAQPAGVSGIQGVAWHPRDGRWQVRARVRGKRISGGHYDDVEEAKANYEALRDLIRGFLEAA